MVRDIAFVRPSTKKKKALASSPSTPASKLPRTAMTSPNQQRNSDAFSSPSTPTRKLPHTSMTSPNQQRNSDAFSSPPTTPSRKAKLKSIPPPTKAELDECYASLDRCEQKPAILRVLDDYAKNFIPVSRDSRFPRALGYLYNPDTLELGYLDLLTECERVYSTVQVTDEQIELVEKSSRDQANCHLWFHQRTGRVTASIFKAACCTNPAMPAQSLVKRFVIQKHIAFLLQQLGWYGCEHEDKARKAFIEKFTQDSGTKTSPVEKQVYTSAQNIHS
ncbi:uncharacterized protein [Amphiura filiformis]|uniref:uncharacterized protein n=1 Tax=Amphiura filiformis TaxID=82378 RepID=UPI003B21E362